MRSLARITALTFLLAGGAARADKPGIATCVSTQGLSPAAAANLAGLVAVTIERQGFRLATEQGAGSFQPVCCSTVDCIRQKAARTGAAGVLNIQLFQIGPALKITVDTFDGRSGARILQKATSVRTSEASVAITPLIVASLAKLKPAESRHEEETSGLEEDPVVPPPPPEMPAVEPPEATRPRDDGVLDWIEIEAHACLGGSELVGDQAGSASSGAGPDDNRVVLAADPEIRARMGTTRFGGGVKAGACLGDLHTVSVQLDYLRERWHGDLDSLDRWSQDFQLLRLIATYRFHYPVLTWLSPFAEAGLGAHVYLDATARYHDAGSATGVSGLDISPDTRLALMLGAGLRVYPVGDLFLTFSYLWDIPVDRHALSSSSIVLGAGYRF